MARGCVALLVLAAASVANAFSSAVLPALHRPATAAAPLNMQMQERVGRRQLLGTLFVGTAALAASPVRAEEAKPSIPADQMIAAPANACAQGAGGKCEELSEGNPFIKELQERSAKNRLKYQKEELESYWNRNYKDFFDKSCTNWDNECNFQQGADGKWTVTAKDNSIKLKESKDQGKP